MGLGRVCNELHCGTVLGKKIGPSFQFLRSRESKSTVKRATRYLQLVMRVCCKTSWLTMLRVLRKKTLAALFAARHARTWLAIRATSLFNSSGSKVAKQVARFTVPQGATASVVLSNNPIMQFHTELSSPAYNFKWPIGKNSSKGSTVYRSSSHC